MPSSKIVRNDFGGLHNLVRVVAGLNKKKVVRVGIMGEKGNRNALGGLKSAKKGGGHKVDKSTPADLTNAEIGAEMEFGSFSKGVPARSFLRMPLNVKQEEIIKEASEGAAERLARGDEDGILRRLGIACENAIQDAFGSRGFGMWKPNRPSTIKRKGSDAPLIDSAQLRKSITSKVVSPS